MKWHFRKNFWLDNVPLNTKKIVEKLKSVHCSHLLLFLTIKHVIHLVPVNNEKTGVSFHDISTEFRVTRLG